MLQPDYTRKVFSMKDEDLILQEVSTEHIIQDEWIDFRRSTYRFPDGTIWQPYYSFTRRDYAVVVASDEDGRLICVRQFRQGIRQVTTEFPAGAIEKKDGENPRDAALRAAQRELREESGYVSDRWRPLLVIPSSASISDNYAYLFAAENCRRVTGQDLDAMELLHVETHTAEELDAMLADGRFQQSVHALAWLLYKETRT